MNSDLLRDQDLTDIILSDLYDYLRTEIRIANCVLKNSITNASMPKLDSIRLNYRTIYVTYIIRTNKCYPNQDDCTLMLYITCCSDGIEISLSSLSVDYAWHKLQTIAGTLGEPNPKLSNYQEHMSELLKLTSRRNISLEDIDYKNLVALNIVQVFENYIYMCNSMNAINK